eukprot:5147272-Lingulodinium_polyedra.AAC.1
MHTKMYTLGGFQSAHKVRTKCALSARRLNRQVRTNSARSAQTHSCLKPRSGHKVRAKCAQTKPQSAHKERTKPV